MTSPHPQVCDQSNRSLCSVQDSHVVDALHLHLLQQIGLSYVSPSEYSSTTMLPHRAASKAIRRIARKNKRTESTETRVSSIFSPFLFIRFTAPVAARSRPASFQCPRRPGPLGGNIMRCAPAPHDGSMGFASPESLEPKSSKINQSP